MTDLFDRGDGLGPAKVVHVREPSMGLRAVLVIDNVARGPAVGGLRMAPDVTVEECIRLARAMTLKNSAAGLAHGGGKSVLWGDPRMPRENKERLIRACAHALRHEEDYIFGPDMGTDEACMAWIKDEIGRAVGLPAAMGGIPLDAIGATGWGLSHAADVAARFCGVSLDGARLAIQGFGAVGTHTAGKSVCDYHAGEKLDRDAVIDIECDIWIPAARPDVIREDNVGRLRTTLVLQGANIPFSSGAEQTLHDRGVLVVPDFIANAGGVMCAAMEYRGATESQAFQAIEEKIRANVEAVLSDAGAARVPPRQAAIRLAGARVEEAMSYRRVRLM